MLYVLLAGYVHTYTYTCTSKYVKFIVYLSKVLLIFFIIKWIKINGPWISRTPYIHILHTVHGKIYKVHTRIKTKATLRRRLVMVLYCLRQRINIQHTNPAVNAKERQYIPYTQYIHDPVAALWTKKEILSQPQEWGLFFLNDYLITFIAPFFLCPGDM